jgi:methionine-S-sulfoxide reductase
MDTVTLGGGCFWCLEAVFQKLQGVESAVSGYTGGDPQRADYKSVCTGSTGHAEVVQIKYLKNDISLLDLLMVYFAVHDPTTLNRQGADVGTQYRSEIFCHDEEQLKTAQKVIEKMNQEKVFANPIVTKVSMIDEFWSAEEYHQTYYQNNPFQPYCIGVVAPKVAKAVKMFPHLIKAS